MIYWVIKVGSKFKVGDIIRYNGNYDSGSYPIYGDNEPCLKKGDIITVSKVSGRPYDVLYGFKEDNQNPDAHWLDVEKNFEIYNPPNWNEILEVKK